MVWMCWRMPIHNCLRCSNTLYMYEMGCGMQFERFCSLKDSVVGSFPYTYNTSRISANSPKSGETSVVVTVWVCCHMPINNYLRCSNTLYMYDMDVGCSLKGSIVFTFTSSIISTSSPKSGQTSVVVTVWMCCHMPIHNCLNVERCLIKLPCSIYHVTFSKGKPICVFLFCLLGQSNRAGAMNVRHSGILIHSRMHSSLTKPGLANIPFLLDSQQ